MTRRLREPRPRSFWRRRHATARMLALLGMMIGLVAVGGAWWQERGPSRVAHAESVSLAAPDSTPSKVIGRSSRGLPLRGVPLQSPTGLRLLVAGAPAPFVLDLDRGSVQRITGLPADGERGVSVLPVGKHALVLSQRFCPGCPPASGVYLVRRGSTAATRLGTAWQAVPSLDGQGVWLLSHRTARRCTIRKLALDGRPAGTARQLSCRTGLVAELPAGLLLDHTGPGGSDAHNELLKPDGRIVRLHYEQAQPIVGNLVLTGADRRTPLLLHNVRARASFRLRWPARPDYGLGVATGQPTGRLATIDFAKYSPEHRFDLWLLDVASRRWQRLPGMPAHVIPKVTDVKWAADGRVVILSSNVLAVWRPGEPRLAIRRVKRPKQPSIQFVLW